MSVRRQPSNICCSCSCSCCPRSRSSLLPASPEAAAPEDGAPTSTMMKCGGRSATVQQRSRNSQAAKERSAIPSRQNVRRAHKRTGAARRGTEANGSAAQGWVMQGPARTCRRAFQQSQSYALQAVANCTAQCLAKVLPTAATAQAAAGRPRRRRARLQIQHTLHATAGCSSGRLPGSVASGQAAVGKAVKAAAGVKSSLAGVALDRQLEPVPAIMPAFLRAHSPRCCSPVVVLQCGQIDEEYGQRSQRVAAVHTKHIRTAGAQRRRGGGQGPDKAVDDEHRKGAARFALQ